MKKLTALFLLIVSVAVAQPIATKSLGTDSASGLQKEVRAWQLTIDTKSEIVVVVYDIVLLSPKGKIVSILETNTYRRTNVPARDSIPADMRFNTLRNSSLGKSIEDMIKKTIDKYPKVEQ